MSQEAHPIPCSLQKPLPPEARPQFVGTGPPAKPVLLRSSPKPLAPAPLAKAPRPPTKPVAVPVLAQHRVCLETSECPIPVVGGGGASRDRTGIVVCPLGPHPVPHPHPPLPTAAPCPDLVRYSTLNSEHFPQPTQQIKNIVRQYQQPPRGGRPEALRSALPLSPPSSTLDGMWGGPSLLWARPPGEQPPARHPAGSESAHADGPNDPSARGRLRPLSRLCCVTSGQSLTLSVRSHVMMGVGLGVEEEVPCYRYL